MSGAFYEWQLDISCAKNQDYSILKLPLCPRPSTYSPGLTAVPSTSFSKNAKHFIMVILLLRGQTGNQMNQSV